jgi:hypothetical protein
MISASNGLPVQFSGIELQVLPLPKDFSPSASLFTIDRETRLFLYSSAGDDDRFAAQEFNRWLEELGFTPLEVHIIPQTGTIEGRGIILSPLPAEGAAGQVLERLGVKDPGDLGDEGYLIAVEPDQAVALASSAAGRFYALMTMAQMFTKSKEQIYLPGGVVLDSPSLSLRGVSDDISRGQVSTLDDLKNLIRLLARYKMNVYMPYLEDMFTLKSHPDFGAGRGALTPADVAELERFARTLHVRVIPIFQTLGHYENFLDNRKHWDIAEFPGAHCLSPAAEETYSFLGDALGEVTAAFSDRFINVGCDESWDVGRGKSREAVRKDGTAAVHAGHYRRVHDLVSSLGRRMMIYGDIILSHPAILGKIPLDIVIVDWHYNAAKNYPSVAAFHKEGFEVVVSPGVSNWNCLYPGYESALVNIENLTRVGFENGALGSVNSSWGDDGAGVLRQLNLWGYAFGGACAWNPLEVDRQALERTFWKQFLAVDEPEPFIEANRLLASLGRGFSLLDWWRNPCLGISTRGLTGKKGDPARLGQDLARDMGRARELLSKAADTPRANLWFVELLDFTARCGEWLGQKFIWQAETTSIRSGAFSSEKAEKLADQAAKLRRDFSTLRDSFSSLWLKYNRPEGLENNLRLFDRQLAFWDIAEKALREDRKLPEAELSSDFIAPSGSAAKRKPDKVRQAFFMGKISIDQGVLIDKAFLQIMGMSHAEVYLNGKFAGETAGRRSLSLIVESGRAKVVDISGLLIPGENIFYARVTNYENMVPALNLYGEIYAGGKVIQQIMTGPEWLGIETDIEPEGWPGKSFREGWKPCTKYDIGLPVSAPLFDKGINSRIER